MVELVKIEQDELRDYIEISYCGDLDLLQKYHVNQYDLDSAVDETLRMIEITSLGIDMKYFGVEENGEKIGYLCTFTHNLYSYAINIKYRTKEVLISFWEKIKEVMKESFITMLFPNNTRAIGWLKKCGMDEVKDVEDNAVVLIYFNN